MSRQEFLQRLKEALIGEVPQNVIEENIRYYDDYISTEARKGSAEEEVTASIGDPRLIAKTIMEASENAGTANSGRTFYESFTEDGHNAYEEKRESKQIHYVDLSKWYWKLLGIVIVVLFFFLVASIVTGIFSLLMPLMGPLLLILLVVWFVRGMKR